MVDGCSVITPTSSSSSITLGEGSICWITVLGALILLWRPELANGCDISCLFIGLLIWEEIFSIHTAIHPNLLEELSDPPSFSSVLKVQWRGSPCQSSGLRLHTFTARTMGSMPGQGTKIPHYFGHDQKSKNKKNKKMVSEVNQG